jgi:prepilin-type processing-associated H-X9-DG protein
MYDYGPYAFHRGGASVVFCDGSVHFLSDSIDAASLCALYAYADGDVVVKY